MHREAMNKMLKRNVLELASPTAHDEYVESVLKKTETECIVYTYDAFLGSRKNALVDGVLYPSLEKKIYPIRQLTQGHDVTLFLPLQHVAQFIEKELKYVPNLRKELYSKSGDFSFSWLTFVWRIREAWPEAKIVIWNVDEIAINWPGFVALLTGYPNSLSFSGLENYTVSCLAEEGRNAFLSSLKSNPPANIPEWIDITSKHFSKYGKYVPVVERVVASPWSPEQVQHSRKKFAIDMKNCRSIQDVFLAHELDFLAQ